ncbi:MAG: HAD family hydrolase [Pirellulaceae bacterium]
MPSSRIRFLYFDLGNVLLTFDQRKAARQMATVAGTTPEKVWDIVFESEMHDRYERGDVSSQQYYDFFCDQSKTRPDPADLRRAASDIFTLNVPIVPIVAQLKATGNRLGILSNTNDAHWAFVSRGRYALLRNYFEQIVLSHEVKASKPEAAIFEAAIEATHLPPQEIFFVDDRAENVEGARAAGLDAVQFTTAGQLAADLRRRGVRFNY